MLKLLLRLGADINARDKNGEPPSQYSAIWGDIDCLRLLIAAGIDLNAKGSKGRTILHRALFHQRRDTVRYLLEEAGAGSIINVVDDEGSTPLDLVSDHEEQKIATMLVEHGARHSSFL